jgi:5-methylcytosine-specific restriction endonuclease McrA
MTAWITKIPDVPIATFDRIAEAKRQPRKSVLRSLRPRIEQWYETYAQTMPDIDKLPKKPLTSIEEEAMLHAYSAPTTPLSQLRLALFDSAGPTKRCCYCQIGSLSQLDHVAPQTQFPEYSVLSHNLVPSCDECNEHKSSTTTTSIGVRGFIHLHGESFVGKRWLYADFEAKKIRFRLQFDDTFSNTEQKILTSHYGRLKLLDRFADRLPEFLIELAEGEWDGTAASLMRRLALLKAGHDPNFYKTSLAEALINQFV